MPNGFTDVVKAIKEGTPIAVMKKEVGEANVAMVLTKMILDFASSFNLGNNKNINRQQAQDLALMLINRFSHGSYESPGFRLEDFALFFERAKFGGFSVKVFDRIDAALISEWMEEYFCEREEKYLYELKRQTELPEIPNAVSGEDWTNLLNQFKADLKSGKAGPKQLTEEEKRKAKEERVENMNKLFWGDQWPAVKAKMKREEEAKKMKQEKEFEKKQKQNKNETI